VAVAAHEPADFEARFALSCVEADGDGDGDIGQDDGLERFSMAKRGCIRKSDLEDSEDSGEFNGGVGKGIVGVSSGQ